MGAFQRAVRHKLKGRIAIDGPSGAGKTFTALRLAYVLGKRIAVINTESGAIQKYLGLAPDGVPWEFDLCELHSYSPSAYTELILEAGKESYDVIVIDSLSHAWEGEGGALEMVDNAKSRNKFAGWKDVTPMHNRMVGAILRSPCHVIVTMRSKTEYVLESDANGKQVPRKIGMAPVQRAGMEYEFDLYCSMDWDHVLRVTKSRCPEMDSALAVKPSAQTFAPLASWLNDGSDVPADYYTAKESDFQKLETKLASSIGQQPWKSALEKAKDLQSVKSQVANAKQEACDRMEESIDDPCSEHQIEQIKQAIDEAAQTGVPDIVSRIKSKLADAGMQKIAELSVAGAEGLLAAIKTKTLEQFFVSDLQRAGEKK
jgi:hypothetical protein